MVVFLAPRMDCPNSVLSVRKIGDTLGHCLNTREPGALRAQDRYLRHLLGHPYCQGQSGGRAGEIAVAGRGVCQANLQIVFGLLG